MYVEARFLLESAVRLAEQRGARLRSITVEGDVQPELAAALTELLSGPHYAGVELILVPGAHPARLASVELDGGR